MKTLFNLFPSSLRTNLFQNTAGFFSLNSFSNERKYYGSVNVPNNKNLKIFKPWFHKNIELSNGLEYIEINSIQNFFN